MTPVLPASAPPMQRGPGLGRWVHALAADPRLDDARRMLGIQVPLDHDQVGALAGRDAPALVLLAAGVGGAGRVCAQPLLVAERLLGAEDAARPGPARGAVRRGAQR